MNLMQPLSPDPPLEKRLQLMLKALPDIKARKTAGILKESNGPVVRVTLENARIGDICELIDPATGSKTLAEIVAVRDQDAILCPYGDLMGMSGLTQVISTGAPLQVPVGEKLLGTILNAFGQPLYDDGRAYSPYGLELRSVRSKAPNPVERPLIDTQFPTGIRAIDGLITIGEGQRIGVFGEAGAGKSVLLSMIARYAKCDVCIIGMIGERGREVREFLERQLPKEMRSNCIAVVSTSDRPPMERVIGAYTASTLAEYFRDQGKSVLLLIDSVTRYARALREVGLAAGEAPARKGFPSSVFSEMPHLIERSGRSVKGSITAIYSVLVDGDTLGDPIAEELRSLTDGHIVLSPKLAQAGHYPAIDILASKSRIMDEITSRDHQSHANHVRSLMNKYNEIELLLQVGEYQHGSDSIGDTAINRHDDINEFLKQSADENSGLDGTLYQLGGIGS